MKLMYIGPFQAVRVPLPGGGEATVEREGVLDTTDTHGEGLLAQPDNWERLKDPPKPKPATGEED